MVVMEAYRMQGLALENGVAMNVTPSESTNVFGEEWINMPTTMLFGSDFDFSTPPIASNYDSSILSLVT
jgi:hypothetical protein